MSSWIVTGPVLPPVFRQTAPVPVVHIEVREERPGGAGNVAMNTVSLGAKATLVGVTGVDEAADSLKAAARCTRC